MVRVAHGPGGSAPTANQIRVQFNKVVAKSPYAASYKAGNLKIGIIIAYGNTTTRLPPIGKRFALQGMANLAKALPKLMLYSDKGNRVTQWVDIARIATGPSGTVEFDSFFVAQSCAQRSASPSN